MPLWVWCGFPTLVLYAAEIADAAFSALEPKMMRTEQTTMQNSPKDIPQLVGDLYRKASRPVFATLIRLLGDFDLAEDAMHDAFKAALEQWAEKGIPSNPQAWLVSTGRFKAIDRIRRQSKFDPLQEQQVRQMEAEPADPSGVRLHDRQARVVRHGGPRPFALERLDDLAERGRARQRRPVRRE
jgi:DNA-directed RNA polymerase specialized sigma24 family protein